jgi:hypothetical protein
MFWVDGAEIIFDTAVKVFICSFIVHVARKLNRVPKDILVMNTLWRAT